VVAAGVRVEIDRAICCGHLRCADVAPAIFGWDDDGLPVIQIDVAVGELEAVARRGAAACPERAITVT
jgi:ferredoxin